MILRRFLKLISVDNITFLHSINKDFFIDKSGKSNYYEIKFWEMEYFSNFVHSIDNNSLYTVIPIISPTNNHDKPYLVLSRSILVSKYSDYKLIHRLLNDRFHDSLDDFGIKNIEGYTLILKYKKVKIDLNQIKRKFDL